jgi:hypothetical protein
MSIHQSKADKKRDSHPIARQARRWRAALGREADEPLRVVKVLPR